MNNIVIYAAIVLVSVVINSFILIIFRKKFSGERTLSNINKSISNCRATTTMLMEKLRVESMSSEEKLRRQCDEGSSLVRQIAETFDSLMAHNKDLSRLDSVCIEYKNALERLKVSTTQTEERISAVLRQIEKAERVEEFLKQFEEDFGKFYEKLTGLRSEYVSLVSTTEEALKNAAEKQVGENNAMLERFYEEFDTRRNEFSDFVASKENSIKEFSDSELEEIRVKSNELGKERDMIFTQVEGAKNWITDQRAEIKNEVELLNTAGDDLKNDSIRIINAVKGNLQEELERFETAVVTVKNDVDTYLNQIKEESDRAKADIGMEADDRKAEIKEETQTAVGRIEDEAEKATDGIRKAAEESAAAIESLSGSIRAVSAEACREIEKEMKNFDIDRAAFVKTSSDILRTSFDSVMDSVDTRWKQLKEASSSIISSIENKIYEVRETIGLLSEGERAGIKATVQKLEELNEKIIETNEKLSEAEEKVKEKAEELSLMQEKVDRTDAEIEVRNEELNNLREQMNGIKEQKIGAEASLVRLKLEMSKLGRDSSETFPEIEESEPTDPGSLFEEFPDDIEIDISDDD